MPNDVEIFYGETTVSLARVYARLTSIDDTSGWSLGGIVRGPYCRYSQTLPLTVPLVDLGRGESLLAQAAIPDPCWWSPDLPALYHVTVELRRAGQVVETVERRIGVRSFGVRGRSLYLNGERWVPRVIHRLEVPQASLDEWRDCGATMLAFPADDSLCADASELGVMLVAMVRGDRTEVAAELRRLARHAAVAMAVIDCADPLDKELRRVAPNIQLVQPFGANQAVQPASWAHIVMCQVFEPHDFPRQTAGVALPVLAARPAVPQADIAAARSACDALQRDLAALGEVAGYIV